MWQPEAQNPLLSPCAGCRQVVQYPNNCSGNAAGKPGRTGMALDFQQIREQVRQLGENAPLREQRLKELRQQACMLLESNAHQIEDLRQKVQDVVRSHDPSLRCALPVAEA